MTHAPRVRKTVYRGTHAEAVQMFSRSPFVHLAGVGPAMEPILRVVHGVVHRDRLYFHAAAAGEKLSLVGREVVAMTQEVVAEIPSYFLDPTRACPATTYYRSAQVRALLRRTDDPGIKAAVMQQLMRRYQPEGGHSPISTDDAGYAAALGGLLIASVGLEEAVAKTKLGQNRRPEALLRVLGALWRRGESGDAAAIEALRVANPELPTPEFLRGPGEITLRCALRPEDAEAAAALLHGSCWNVGVDPVAVVDAQREASAWVGAYDPGVGRLVGTARAVSDGISHAWIADVAVTRSHRGRGIGGAIVRLLLDHPAVRDARRAELRTCDAQSLYRRLGFEEVAHDRQPVPGGRLTTMSRRRVLPKNLE